MTEYSKPTSITLRVPEMLPHRTAELNKLLGQMAALGVGIESGPVTPEYTTTDIVPVTYEAALVFAESHGYRPEEATAVMNGLGRLFHNARLTRYNPLDTNLVRCPLWGILPPKGKFIAHLPTLDPTIAFIRKSGRNALYGLGTGRRLFLEQFTKERQDAAEKGLLHMKAFRLDHSGKIIDEGYPL